MIIQMVTISEDTSLFITGYDMKTNTMTFRTSRVPEYKQSEVIQKGEKGMLHTNIYFFQEGYLSKFLLENNLINNKQ